MVRPWNYIFPIDDDCISYCHQKMNHSKHLKIKAKCKHLICVAHKQLTKIYFQGKERLFLFVINSLTVRDILQFCNQMEMGLVPYNRVPSHTWSSHHFLVIIFKYSRALWAAAVWASFELLPEPWQTATGSVDNCTKHWYFPETHILVDILYVT